MTRSAQLPGRLASVEVVDEIWYHPPSAIFVTVAVVLITVLGHMAANQDPVEVKRIHWLKIFPILNLWEALRMGFRLRVFIPCLLVSLAFVAFSTRDFSSPQARRWSGQPLELVPHPISDLVRTAVKIGPAEGAASNLTFGHIAFYVILIALAGVAVGRSTATEFCQQSRTGPVAALNFSVRHFRNILVTTFLACFICVIPLLLSFVCRRVFSSASEVGIVVLLAVSILVAATAIVLSVAWLLSLTAIGTDRCDGSDALSRSISYVLSHKTYTVVLLTFVLLLAESARLMSYSVLAALIERMLGATSEWPRFHLQLIDIVPNAIALGVMFSGVTITYILLRGSEDAVDLRELDGGKAAGARMREAKSE